MYNAALLSLALLPALALALAPRSSAWVASSASRRDVFASAPFLSLCLAGPSAASAKCKDLESCREEGDRRIAQQELQAGPIVNLGNSVRYREPQTGAGDLMLQEGDSAEITFMVTTTGGNYMWSYGRNIEPGQQDYGETLTVVVGKHDVPVAVEMALVGMKKGSVRRVEMPPSLGLATSNGQPAPTTFSGKKKLERYGNLLTGNGLQPGYEAMLIFDVAVVKIKPKKN